MSLDGLMEYFRIESVTAFVFFDMQGNPIQRVSGYWSAEKFGALLDYMRNAVYKKNIPFERYMAEAKR